MVESMAGDAAGALLLVGTILTPYSMTCLAIYLLTMFAEYVSQQFIHLPPTNLSHSAKGRQGPQGTAVGGTIILNCVLAFSNITAIYPIRTAFLRKDFLTFLPVLLVSLASFISHIVANHRNGLRGVYPSLVSVRQSALLTDIDRVLSIFIFARLLYLLPTKKFNRHQQKSLGPNYIFRVCLLLFFNTLSALLTSHEIVYPYVAVHSTWHVFIYLAIDELISLPAKGYKQPLWWPFSFIQHWLY
jgi:hypothetical protein